MGAGGEDEPGLLAPVDDAPDDVTCVEDRGLGEAVPDGRSLAAALHEARRPEDPEVLAGVGERDAEDCRQVADRAFAVPQGVEQPESLGIREDLADLRVKPVALKVDVGGHGVTVRLVARLRNYQNQCAPESGPARAPERDHHGVDLETALALGAADRPRGIHDGVVIESKGDGPKIGSHCEIHASRNLEVPSCVTR